MLNKKVLLAALLLAIPSFGLMNPKEAKGIADKFNGEITKEQLPNLLEAINKAIELACEKGEYDTTVKTEGYSGVTIHKAEGILEDRGYSVSPVPITGELFISWD